MARKYIRLAAIMTPPVNMPSTPSLEGQLPSHSGAVDSWFISIIWRKPYLDRNTEAQRPRALDSSEVTVSMFMHLASRLFLSSMAFTGQNSWQQ